MRKSPVNRIDIGNQKPRPADAARRAVPVDQRVRDADARNWVDAYAPAAMRPYLRLSRADRPIGTWLLFIPCLWAITLGAVAGGWNFYALWLIAGAGLGAFLMRGAGCTWNDIQDRRIDAEVERTRSRPIPSGQVSVKAALIWMVAQALAAFLILLSFNANAILWGILSIVPVAVYPFAKRFTWWPQAFLGIAFNWGALLLWVAYTGEMGLAAIYLYLAGIAWTLHYDTIYAHQDRDDDALIGVRSTALLFGDETRGWLWFFTALAVALALFAAVYAGGGWFALLGVGGFGLHLAWQIVRVEIDDPASCLKVFRSSRDAGLIPVAGFVLDSLV